MCLPFSTSTANWITDRQFRSVCTTTLAMLRWTKTSPGATSMIWLAGTRESEQPIHRYSGDCSRESRSKKPGSSALTRSDHLRLLSSSSERVGIRRGILWAGPRRARRGSEGARPPAVHRQVDAGYVGGGGRAQEGDGGGGFLGAGKPPQRDVGDHLLEHRLLASAAPFGAAADDLLDAGSVREAGEHVVDRDAVRPKLAGEGLGPGGDGPARRVGDAQPRDGFLHRGGDDVDDAAVATFAHAGQQRPHQHLA